MTLPPLEVILRLAAAMLIGGALGVDREVRGKPAGLRTHALVAMGAALATITAIQFAGPADRAAVTRVIQGIVAGVGFLGGGAILRAHAQDEVRGLTTAATIWLVAAIGIACGGGQWAAAWTTLVLAVAMLVVGQWVEGLLHRIFDRWRNKGKMRMDED